MCASLRTPGFFTGAVHVGSVVDSVALRQDFLPTPGVSSISYYSNNATYPLIYHPKDNFFLVLFQIFTICFKEAISKLFERLHFEGRCYPVIVLPRVEHFLIIIVFYCNISVGHCRCSLLLASGGNV